MNPARCFPAGLILYSDESRPSAEQSPAPAHRRRGSLRLGGAGSEGRYRLDAESGSQMFQLGIWASCFLHLFDGGGRTSIQMNPDLVAVVVCWGRK